MDLALNNVQRLICHKNQPTNHLSICLSIYVKSFNYIFNVRIKCIQSTQEILKTHKPHKGIISSIGMENLFTNVPVLEIINMVINNIYHRSRLPPLKIYSNILSKILLLCITEVPFYDPHGNIYIQRMDSRWRQS